MVVAEIHSQELRAFVRDTRMISSVLARVETVRTTRLAGASVAAEQRATTEDRMVAEAEAVLESVELLAIDAGIIAEAARLQPASLRSLDAIHLATALGVAGLDALVTYDDELGRAAEANGLRVLSPGRPA